MSAVEAEPDDSIPRPVHLGRFVRRSEPAFVTVIVVLLLLRIVVIGVAHRRRLTAAASTAAATAFSQLAHLPSVRTTPLPRLELIQILLRLPARELVPQPAALAQVAAMFGGETRPGWVREFVLRVRRAPGRIVVGRVVQARGADLFRRVRVDRVVFGAAEPKNRQSVWLSVRAFVCELAKLTGRGVAPRHRCSCSKQSRPVMRGAIL